MRGRRSVEQASRKGACPTADVKNALIICVEGTEQHLVRRPKKQPLQRIPLVPVAPAIKLFSGIGDLIGHYRCCSLRSKLESELPRKSVCQGMRRPCATDGLLCQ